MGRRKNNVHRSAQSKKLVSHTRKKKRDRAVIEIYRRELDNRFKEVMEDERQ